MLKVLRYCVLLAVAGCLLLAQPLVAAEEGIKGNLVSVNWLEKHLKDADVLILDTSGTQIYTAKHIPGAVSADLFSYGLLETPVADMEKIFQSWGVSSGKMIVMYDQGGGMMATRVLFALCYHGFPAENLFVLDGGLSKWEEGRLPVTKDSTPVPKQGSYKIEKLNDDVRVKLPEFLTASGDPVNSALVEALGANGILEKSLPFRKPAISLMASCCRVPTFIIRTRPSNQLKKSGEC